MREELKLSTHHMPKSRLLALWKALDEDGSGFICAGEFGRFMRANDGKRVAPIDQKVAEGREMIAQKRIDEQKRKEDEWTRRAAKRSEANARALQLETERLEAALAEAGSSLPAISGGRGGVTSSKSMPSLRNGGPHVVSANRLASGLKAERAEVLNKLAREVGSSVGRSARVMHEM